MRRSAQTVRLFGLLAVSLGFFIFGCEPPRKEGELPRQPDPIAEAPETETGFGLVDPDVLPGATSYPAPILAAFSNKIVSRKIVPGMNNRFNCPSNQTLVTHSSVYRNRASCTAAIVKACDGKADCTVSLKPDSCGAQSFPVQYTIDINMLCCGHGDHRCEIQKKINEALVSADIRPEVRLDAKDYLLSCEQEPSWTPDLNNPSRYCLSLAGFSKSLTLKGRFPSTRLLSFSPRSGVFNASDNAEISIHSFLVDYSTPPFTQGIVRSVNPTEFTFQVDEGFITPDHPLLSSDFFESNLIAQAKIGFAHPKGKRTFKGDNETSAVWMARSPSRIGNSNLWSVKTDPGKGKYPDSTKFLEVGDKFSYGPRTLPAFRFNGNKVIRLSGINLYTSPGTGFLFVGNHELVSVKNIKVLPLGNGRLLSTVGDAFHFVSNSARIVLEDSFIQGAGDDALNVRAANVDAVAVSGDRLTLAGEEAGRSPPQLPLGEVLQLVRKIEEVPTGTGRPEKLELVGYVRALEKLGGYTYRVDADFPADSRIHTLFIMKHASVGSQVLRNTFVSNRGIVRLRSPGARFVGNRFIDHRFARVLYSINPAAAGPAGPITPGPIAMDNLVLDAYRIPSETHRVRFLEMWSGGDYLEDRHLEEVSFNGVPEFAQAPEVFDSNWYFQSTGRKRDHWISRGAENGEQGSLHFSSQEYLQMYPGSVVSGGGKMFVEAILDFQANRASLGRVGRFALHPDVFNPIWYAEKNPDLKLAFKGDIKKLTNHWLASGISAQRVASSRFSCREYLESHREALASIYGSSPNCHEAIAHYVLGKSRP